MRARHEVGIERPRHVLRARSHPVFAPLLETLWHELGEGSESAVGAIS